MHLVVTKPQTSTFPRSTDIMQPRKKRHPYPSQGAYYMKMKEYILVVWEVVM